MFVLYNRDYTFILDDDEVEYYFSYKAFVANYVSVWLVPGTWEE